MGPLHDNIKCLQKRITGKLKYHISFLNPKKYERIKVATSAVKSYHSITLISDTDGNIKKSYKLISFMNIKQYYIQKTPKTYYKCQELQYATKNNMMLIAEESNHLSNKNE